MKDDLEYYISFPSAEQNLMNGDGFGNNVQDFYHDWRRLKVEPVIFLLGWLGAQDKHLAKYSSMYNKLGCITVRYTTPMENIFISPDAKLKPIAKKLINLLMETSLANHPVIFHNFSNNGSILYSYISQSLENSQDIVIDIKGSIFDSTPAPRRLLLAMRAVYRSLEGPVLWKMFASSALGIYLCFCGISKILSSLFSFRWLKSRPWSLIEEPFKWPQLFLYSEADDLIPYQAVERFAKARESLGVKVFKHNFVNSPHVAHYKFHSEEYMMTVSKFIKFSLSENKDILIKDGHNCKQI